MLYYNEETVMEQYLSQMKNSLDNQLFNAAKNFLNLS